MPGFMGLRGLNPKNPHDLERQRREERKTSKEELERRAEEKAQEILRGQQGDMSAHIGDMPVSDGSDFQKTANFLVGEIMSERVAVLEFDDNLMTVQGIFRKVKFRHLPVVEPDGDIIGILSDRDFLRMVSPFFGTVNEQTRDKELMTRKVGTIMTRNPICARVDTTILETIRLMNANKISCLPILEAGGMRLLGIVTWKDIVRAFCPRAFDSTRDSARLKTGVRINPQTAESARLRALAAEIAKAPDAGVEEGGRGSAAGGASDAPAVPDSLSVLVPDPDPVSSSLPAGSGDGGEVRGGSEQVVVAPPASEALERKRRARGSDTDRFVPVLDEPPGEGIDKPLEKGLSGLELATKQRASLREQLEKTTNTARLRALRDEQHHRKDSD